LVEFAVLVVNIVVVEPPLNEVTGFEVVADSHALDVEESRKFVGLAVMDSGSDMQYKF
jgi:hypothetical protein